MYMHIIEIIALYKYSVSMKPALPLVTAVTSVQVTDTRLFILKRVLLRIVTHGVEINPYRRFGTNYPSNLSILKES